MSIAMNVRDCFPTLIVHVYSMLIKILSGCISCVVLQKTERKQTFIERCACRRTHTDRILSLKS